MEFIVWATVSLDSIAVGPGTALRYAVETYPILRQARAAAEHMAAKLGRNRYDTECGCWFVENPGEPLIVVSLERRGLAAEAA